MENPNPHGFFPAQGNPEPSPPPISGGVDVPGAFRGSSAQAQEGKSNGLRDTPTGLHGHPVDIASASKPKFKKKQPDPSGAHATAPCSECGKRFWSQKALFGHMRCHPERQWRGINPPPHLHRPQASLERPPPPVRRPRPPFCAPQRFYDVEHEVATYLVMLANGPTKAGGPGVTWRCAVDASEWSSKNKPFGLPQAKGEQLATYKNPAACAAAARNGGEEEENGTSCLNNAESAASGGMISSGRRAASSSSQAPMERMRLHWESREDMVASSPSAKGCVPDLNLPPPLENSDSSA